VNASGPEPDDDRGTRGFPAFAEDGHVLDNGVIAAVIAIGAVAEAASF
jgi:hypothetical protein